jgi:acetyl esterase/lipase
MSNVFEKVSRMMVYLLKLLSAKCMRSIVSLTVKFMTPSQTICPKPTITVHLDRLLQSKQRQRQPLRVDVYLPSNHSNITLPVVINMHGSGFVLSTFGDDARFCQLIADQVGCAVFDVDYSKAPEKPYPSANQDAESVLEWIREKKEIEKKLQSKAVSIYSDRVALTGFSSGGNLVLTTCVRSKESKRLDMIKAVVAFYPS